MHSRNQNKPPATLLYNNTSRSPLINKGEVLDEVQSCERRKICGGKVVCPAASTRSRPPLSIVNEASVSTCSVPASISSNGESKENQHEFMSREDVEKLLAEKPRPERKSDVKGGLEKMQGHVKNLKTCIRWYMDREDGYLREQEKLQSTLESENRRHSHAEAQMSCKIDDLTLLNEELQRHKLTLEESLRKEEASKLHSQQEAAEQRDALENEVCCLKNELQLVSIDRDHQLELVESMTVGLKKYEEFIAKSSRDIDEALKRAEETSSSQQDQIKNLCCQLSAANEKLKKTDLALIETIQENEAKKKLINELQNHIIDLECQLVEAEKLRKKLHNTILELKGNIRVFCRVRPTLLDNHSSGADGTIMSYPTGIEYLGRGIDLMHNDQKISFAFDKVFGPDASQEDVFVEIAQLVQSALDGYKVCIFAYGQTGSGKTYTMMGNPEGHEQKGLIPRSLEQIFEVSQALKWQGWKYKMQASLLEIYNETIRDLLSPTISNSTDATHNKQFTIKHDSAGNTHVSDLTVVDVCSINEVSFLLKQAGQSRSIGKTQMNEESSRSHFVFTLRISGMNELTKQHVQGVLNLIDLAGSERLAKSGSTGDRLKEAQAINKSLSSLNDVILAIAKEEDHVPYRNSKLTYLLKPCLGGDSKTLMFVNISPEASSANESICSLRFATRVNACEIKMPRRHSQVRPPVTD